MKKIFIVFLLWCISWSLTLAFEWEWVENKNSENPYKEEQISREDWKIWIDIIESNKYESITDTWANKDILNQKSNNGMVNIKNDKIEIKYIILLIITFLNSLWLIYLIIKKK